MRREDMKTSFLVSAVVAAHVLAVGSALLIQGCGTTRGPVELPEEHPMPPKVGLEPVERPPVAEVEEEAKPVVPEAKTWSVGATTTYIVAKGDTLSQIASRYDLKTAEIMALNDISNPNTITIGQKLILPGKIDVDAAPKPVVTKPTPTVESAPVTAEAGTYVVKAGDCLSVIAARAGVKTKDLRNANKLKDDKIYVGQKLVIPEGGNVPAPEAVVPETKPEWPVMPAVKDTPVVKSETIDVVEELPVTDLAPEPPSSAAGETTYTVKAGDDILSVASEHNVSIADLRSVNKLSSDLLVPGQKLIIPTTD
jgi:D-gamma-glutamyl-meso-diaminopimelic acid endopeptidase CwlS